MSQYQFLLWEVKGGIAYLTINRPDKLNALNFALLDELRDAVRTIYDDESVKAAILRGAGDKAFVAGADIAEFIKVNEFNGRKIAENGQEIMTMIENCPKPILAAINGFALGGGCELALACHIRVASTNAKLGLPEVTLGIIPGYGGTQRLTHLVGKGRAFELIMTGDMISAEEAWRMGIVNHITEPGATVSKCEEILSKILMRAPVAIGQVVETVNAAFNETKDGFQVEANSFAICAHTHDFKEGTQAFLEKRKPQFNGK
ncbi:MAG: enoyl-CoA hydratase-related protein [Cytophagaceae bacterium]|jgi:enoyl-CoA hydratase|nr:enoyl-CoA hydratase-related protein [Cytophagaceae bacterium]